MDQGGFGGILFGNSLSIFINEI